MDLELITIGTELLLGFTVDTNAAEMGRALATVGARVVRRCTVADETAAIRSAVREAMDRTGFVIATGGLGPTKDDVTKRVVADLCGVPLDLDQVLMTALEARWERAGRKLPMPVANRTQAEVPRGATVLSNPRGTAPGLWIDHLGKTVVLLPGVPREMRGLVHDEVLPRLQRMNGTKTTSITASLVLRTTGVAESALADAIGEREDHLAPLTLAYLPGLDGVDLRLTAWSMPEAQARTALADAAAKLRPAIGSWVYGEDETDLAQVVLDRLGARGLTLATAESCTGGLIGARLTEIPGSSKVYLGGVVAYADEVKRRDLDVPADVIKAHGAVSEPVVRAMAEGARRRFGAGAAIAVTGIAGPEGGTPEKPVGTVWLSVSAGDQANAVVRRFMGERDEVRHRAAQGALELLRRLLES